MDTLRSRVEAHAEPPMDHRLELEEFRIDIDVLTEHLAYVHDNLRGAVRLVGEIAMVSKELVVATKDPRYIALANENVEVAKKRISQLTQPYQPPKRQRS